MNKKFFKFKEKIPFSGLTILEDVWINVIYGEIEQAKLLIDGIVPKHPFDEKYNKVESVEWENCYKVLNSKDVSDILKKPW